ncbi:uncharacterized protein LOC131997890 [Stomoxys calcitrans]|uniref:uncharacterized protein LOC131997890 n=1 Tax=Stomoxys calcitrans TaxID=35570 RepID=UPI0027E35E17|nr:uncharacterized protein LOC131997890 [Stomoxys calcitrans]
MTLNTAMALILLSYSGRTQETTTLPHKVNNSFAIEVVTSMHSMYQFENFAFYISQHLMDSNLAGDFLQRFWNDFSMVPSVIMLSNIKKMKGFLDTASLCLVLTTNRKDPIMQVAASSLEGVRRFKTLFLYFPLSKETPSFHQEIDHIYEWIWQNQFINSALLTVDNNVFIQEPYPRPLVVNIAENWSVESFFVNYRVNFKGYIIDTPMQRDIPRVFYMTKAPPGVKDNKRISGFSGKFFIAFVEHINATYLQADRIDEPAKLDEILDMVKERKLEISMHSYTDMLNPSTDNSYPIGINDWCIMVPFRNRTPEHEYLHKSFQTYSWLLICFSVVYIALGIWLCSPVDQRDLGLSFLQAVCSTLLIMPLKLLYIPTAHMRFLFLLLFVLGFLETNLYISKMASYLTATPEGPQINTIQDIIDEQLPIMVMTYEYAVLVLKNFPQEFLDLVVTVNQTRMNQHRAVFNTSYGYSTQSDRWNFANLQQRYLKNPIFRLSKICLGPYYMVYPLVRDSHLAQPLNDFVWDTFETGHTMLWQMEAFADALYLGYVHMIPNQDHFEPLTLNFYRSLWMLWGCGLLLSCLAFSAEMQSGRNWRKWGNSCCKCFESVCDKIMEM